MSLYPPASSSVPARQSTRRTSLSQSTTTLPSAKNEIDQLNATASGLLGLSFSPIPGTSPLPPTPGAAARAPASRPVAIPTRKSGRRGSEAGATGSVGASGSLSSSLSGMDKKKSGGGGGASLKRETLGTRTSSRTSVPPKLFDHRTNSDSSTPPPFSFSSSPATPASSLLSPQSLPAHVSILASGNPEDDGEILEDEMKDLKNGKGGKRRSASVFRCESCSKIYRHPSCLVKHRWQHSPHWEQSSKLLLSKHQQVQVLEAATILVHLAPNSLPEDKSLWPAAVSPSSHPMPSISFMDSRQRSKATSTHASNLLRQQSVQSSTPPVTVTEIGAVRPTASSRSSEEVMSSASSPDSSAEDGQDSEDDILDDDDEENNDSGYGQSFPVKQEHTAASMAVPPAPSMGERRTSFGTTTALMGRMGLGSLPLRSPVSGPDHSLASTSPYGASSLSAGVPVINYSTSPNANAGAVYHTTTLGTSPHLPMPSSSLRGGALHEEDEDEEEDEEMSEGARSRGVKEGSKGSEEEGDWNTMDMEM